MKKVSKGRKAARKSAPAIKGTLPVVKERTASARKVKISDEQQLASAGKFVLISKEQAEGMLDLIAKCNAWRDHNLPSLMRHEEFLKLHPNNRLTISQQLELDLEHSLVHMFLLRTTGSLIVSTSLTPDNGCSNCIVFNVSGKSQKKMVVCPTCKVIGDPDAR